MRNLAILTGLLLAAPPTGLALGPTDLSRACAEKFKSQYTGCRLLEIDISEHRRRLFNACMASRSTHEALLKALADTQALTAEADNLQQLRSAQKGRQALFSAQNSNARFQNALNALESLRRESRKIIVIVQELSSRKNPGDGSTKEALSMGNMQDCLSEMGSSLELAYALDKAIKAERGQAGTGPAAAPR